MRSRASRAEREAGAKVWVGAPCSAVAHHPDLSIVGDAADEDVAVRMAGVVMVDSDPVELRLEVDLHLRHQISHRLPQVVELKAVLGRDDEAELVPILAAPFEEGAAAVS